jgi:hypothetical protein
MLPVRGRGPLAQFAEELRALQVRTGGTVHHAQRLGASRTAVYSALAGTRLPTGDTLDRIVIGWGANDEVMRWRRRRSEVEVALGEEARQRGEVRVKRTGEEEYFARTLVDLWQQAHRPSRNEWGQAAKLSPRTIASYLDGSTLPTPAKFRQLIEGLADLCSRNDELADWVLSQGLIMREEHLYRARVARKEAREQARVLAAALRGGQPGSTHESAVVR